MSESFAPCPSCRRHVRVSDEGCPFCGAGLDAGEQRGRVRPGVDPRLSRAAALAAAALAVAACQEPARSPDSQVVVPPAPRGYPPLAPTTPAGTASATPPGTHHGDPGPPVAMYGMAPAPFPPPPPVDQATPAPSPAPAYGLPPRR